MRRGFVLLVVLLLAATTFYAVDSIGHRPAVVSLTEPLDLAAPDRERPVTRAAGRPALARPAVGPACSTDSPGGWLTAPLALTVALRCRLDQGGF
ncbi:hypothetical protein ACFP3Q_02585 [Nocardioides sp. GCM10027113]|uniref:hypothetical protein n=1 Tax=unclassified Nocardioides TaxID=2615069 RepID=UPI00360C3E93